MINKYFKGCRPLFNSNYPLTQVEMVEGGEDRARQLHIPTALLILQTNHLVPQFPVSLENIIIDCIHQLRPSILYTSYAIMLSTKRESIQEPQAGSPRASSTRSFKNFSSLPAFAEHIISPLQVERTRIGVGRSRSMIVEVNVLQGRKSSPRRRRGSLTFADSINALPRAGSSRLLRVVDSNLEAPPDSTRRTSMF